MSVASTQTAVPASIRLCVPPVPLNPLNPLKSAEGGLHGGRSGSEQLSALAEQKESELRQVHAARFRLLESQIASKDKALSDLQQQLTSLKDAFGFNLQLLHDRDEELERLEACCVTYRRIIADKERAFSESQVRAKDADATALRLQQSLAESDVFLQNSMSAQSQQHLHARAEWEAEHRTHLERWECERRDVLQRMRRAEVSASSAEEERSHCAMQLSQLREGVCQSLADAREDERATAQVEVRHARAEAERTRAALSAAEGRGGQLQLDAASAQAALRSAQEELQRARADQRHAQITLDELQQLVIRLQAEGENHQQSMSELQSQLAAARLALRESQQSHEEQRKHEESLAQQLGSQVGIASAQRVAAMAEMKSEVANRELEIRMFKTQVQVEVAASPPILWCFVILCLSWLVIDLCGCDVLCWAAGARADHSAIEVC